MVRRLLSVSLLVSMLLSNLSAIPGSASVSIQRYDPFTSARNMLSQMTPEERVGQLFLVTFTGTNTTQNSQIYSLIHDHHIGGVVLEAANDNFISAPETISATYDLISRLQNIEYQASQTQPEPTGTYPTSVSPSSTNTPKPTSTPDLLPPAVLPNYIPLFVGVSQVGDGLPRDQILHGLTPLPDLMAIGATWDTTLAQQVGMVAGQELSSIGFNLYFGPSLDVLENPDATLGNGLNSSTFGGDPYWVGAMGSAYIAGLHEGSQSRMLVIADHFPGRGSADRPAGGEPATVRSSLEQLKQIELAPFFSVTGNASSSDTTTDGLLVSHIRYQGFQGNIHAYTRPVSFDPQALAQILSLPAFASWRSAGGLMVSDDLGSPTVRAFYDPGGTSFAARLVARDAFLAGNDLLFMGNITSSDAPDNYTSIIRTLEFFDQKYQEDSAFAQRVDDSVIRILAAKYRTYGIFDPVIVTPSPDNLRSVGKNQSITFEIARQSATLVSPDLSDLDTVLPSPPSLTDRIIFLTDNRGGRQCSTCGDEPMLAVDALQNVILRLYGPQAGGQVLPSRLISYTFTSLNAILAGGQGDRTLEDDIRQAGWVIINMVDAGPGEPQTTVLRNFLSERQDLLRDKRIVVFAFNAPYFLDATDISKLTAYYCLYSKSAPFVEVAARLLFRELTPSGSLPVSVSGVGYDLFTATSPDPRQIIGLSMDLSTAPEATASLTPEATATPFFRVGDTVSIRTSIIIDHNGHPVPDGTGVRFTISLGGESGGVQEMDADTRQGMASITYSISRPGLLQITAESDPALSSVTLQLNVSGEGVSVTVVAPTPLPGSTSTPEVIETPEATPTPPPAEKMPGISGWLMMIVLLGSVDYLLYWLVNRFSSLKWALRTALCSATGGLLTYTYFVMRLPGATSFLENGGLSGILGMVIVGAVIGFGIAYLWGRLSMGLLKR